MDQRAVARRGEDWWTAEEAENGMVPGDAEWAPFDQPDEWTEEDARQQAIDDNPPCDCDGRGCGLCNWTGTR